MPQRDAEGEQLLDFIGELYSAALEPAQWQALAAKLASRFDTQSCLLLIADTTGNGSTILGATENIGGKFLKEYEAYYYREDQWLAGCLRQPGQMLLGRQLAPAGWYKSIPFLNEFYVGAGICDLMGVAVPISDAIFGFIGIHRARDRAEFAERDIERLNLLLPHITRAMELTVKLAGARIDYQAALDGLERTGTAVVVVDRGAMILSSNSLAEVLFRRGSSLKSVNGRLTAADRIVAERLSSLIRGATVANGVRKRTSGAMAIEGEDSHPPITLLVTPFKPQLAGLADGMSAALIFVRDPETPALATEILRDLFGLTRAQAAVAAQIVEGRDPEQIAGALNITLHTVRDHLKIIFAKTGTSRQSQLVALLAPTVATLRSTALDAGFSEAEILDFPHCQRR
jgi:DNA-binding CsgD family transcriptional regulator